MKLEKRSDGWYKIDGGKKVKITADEANKILNSDPGIEVNNIN